jgi:hypothetical protein
LSCVALRCLSLRCVVLRCLALSCVTFHCVALRCVAFGRAGLNSTFQWTLQFRSGWRQPLPARLSSYATKHGT